MNVLRWPQWNTHLWNSLDSFCLFELGSFLLFAAGVVVVDFFGTLLPYCCAVVGTRTGTFFDTDIGACSGASMRHAHLVSCVFLLYQ